MNAIAHFFRRFIDSKPKRQQTQKGKYAGIAKVLIGNGPDHAGMGIVVDPFHMITCAHVVNVALEKDESAEDKPSEPVNVVFPMFGDPTPIQATIDAWRPPGLKPKDDIAILRLASEIPEEVGVATLADVTKVSPDGDELSIFGLAGGDFLGNHVDAKFKGPTSAAWVQLDGTNAAFIEGGFSGAAVWDQPHSAVLGMVVAKKVSDKQHVAYMIPTAELSEFWPDTPVEDRALWASFARTWTVFSTAYFFLVFAHWAWDRGMQTFSAVTLARNHQELAAFWGMHIYAFLAPFLLWMLITFAKSFRLHDWSARVPSFGEVRARPASSSTWRTATASLAAFVILPLAAQIHFLNQFLTKGDVYIYPDKFGYETSELRAMGETCFENSMHYCTLNKEAGRFSLATPKSNAKGGYWDNAYHFGDRSKGEGGTVTLFPILQPAVILFLTAFSATLSAIALYLVFRRTPEQLQRKKMLMEAKADSPSGTTNSLPLDGPRWL